MVCQAQSGLTTHPGEGEPQRSDAAAGNYQQQIKSYEYGNYNQQTARGYKLHVLHQA